MWLLGLLVALITPTLQAATLTVIPKADLLPSASIYTQQIGGGIGSVVVTTGGGDGANIGQTNGRNDDGFAGPLPLGFSLRYGGADYSSFFINNNGSISFGGGIAAFSGSSLVSPGILKSIADFYAGDPNNRGGIRVAVKNLDGDNKVDLVTGAGSGDGSAVTTYSATALLSGPNPAALSSFNALSGLDGGVFVG